MVLVIFAIYVSLLVAVKPGVFGKIICHFFYSIHVILYTITFLKNPGIPSLDNSRVFKDNEISDFQLCRECMLHHSIEAKTQHCFECGVCVENYDHHCPWIGKCIGSGNKYFFTLFVISSLIMTLCFIIVGVVDSN